MNVHFIIVQNYNSAEKLTYSLYSHLRQLHHLHSHVITIWDIQQIMPIGEAGFP